MCQNKKLINKYKKIINNLIKNSFPILKNRKILVYESIWLKLFDFSADAKRFPYFFRIRVNSRLQNYNKKLLSGTFSHELSHLETFAKMNFFKYYIIRRLKLNFEKYVKKEERETDIIAIKKGYAKALYLQRKSRWKKASKKQKRLYLSQDEIKEIAIKLNKWG